MFAKFTTADKERQLEDALMMGDPITELTIALEANYFRLNNAEYFTPIMVKIPRSELALARKRGAEHKRSDATVAEWTKRPIEYDTGYTLLPGAYEIKVLARDSENRNVSGEVLQCQSE